MTERELRMKESIALFMRPPPGFAVVLARMEDDTFRIFDSGNEQAVFDDLDDAASEFEMLRERMENSYIAEHGPDALDLFDQPMASEVAPPVSRRRNR
jgi:hypothetical protein